MILIFARYIPLLFSCLVFCITLTAQVCVHELGEQSHPKDIPNAKQYSQNYIEKIEASLSKDLSAINHKHKNEINKQYETRVKHLSILAEEGHLFQDKELLDQIRKIGKRLTDANNINNGERIQWVINRTGNPNAACFGEGTLMLNLGLLSKMQNLDQVAFIMAHELGHFQLDHVNKKIIKNIVFLEGKDLQKKIKAAASDKEKAREELIEMMDQFSIANSQHSREHESETDKIGFEFYIKAGFPKEQAVEAMKLLKNIDLSKYPSPSIKSIFSDCIPNWKDSWTKTQLSGLSLIKPSESEIEKYRTHPKTDERIKQLLALGSEENEDNINSDWCKQTISLDIEILHYAYWSGNKFAAFTQALQLHELSPNNSFVNSILGNCLADFIIARERHKFSSIVPSPNIKMKDHYFATATFLDNINLSSLKEICTSWVHKEVPLVPSDVKDKEAIEALKIKLDYIEEKNVEVAMKKFNNTWPKSQFLNM